MGDIGLAVAGAVGGEALRTPVSTCQTFLMSTSGRTSRICSARRVSGTGCFF